MPLHRHLRGEHNRRESVKHRKPFLNLRLVTSVQPRVAQEVHLRTLVTDVILPRSGQRISRGTHCTISTHFVTATNSGHWRLYTRRNRRASDFPVSFRKLLRIRAFFSRQVQRRIMQIVRLVRCLVLAIVVLAISASSFAGVFISVNIAPPVLPVYTQPPCPGDGYIWTPGYWAYGPDGYFWVPGT